ncbi:MAG TPA: MFS transporter [Tepidisphaeraceae bacterium]
MHAETQQTAAPASVQPPDGLQSPPWYRSYRWAICALLFFATTINYVDRSVLNVIAADVQKIVGWTDTQYGDINAAFSFAYAIGFLLFGWIIDRVGVKIGYALSLLAWSIAAAGHALANTPLGFGVARFSLGLGEAGNFPAAIKTVAEWFPRRERALATGIFNAGSNVGAFLAPVVAPILFLRYGWHSVFIVTGVVGMIWVFFWIPLYHPPETHPKISQQELDYIHSEPIEKPRKVRWLHLLPHRQTWAFAVGKFLTDPIWWFYLFWSGKFVSDQFHVDIKHIGPPLIIIYLLADIGSVAGGWLSSSMLKRGFQPNAARKVAMIVCAGFILPVIYAPLTSNLWVAVILIGVAAAAHQGFSANIFTTTSDMFPKWAVGSVTGFGGMAGAIGGIIMQMASGRIKDATGSYLIMFIIAGTVYLLAILLFHILAPRMDTAEIAQDREPNMGLCLMLGGILAAIGAAIAVPLSYLFQNKVKPFSSYIGDAFTAIPNLIRGTDTLDIGRTVLFTLMAFVVLGFVAGMTIGARRAYNASAPAAR